VSGANSKFESRGFTLLEVMMAMAILSIGILGLVGMQITAIRANRQGSKMSQALFLAESKADLLLSYSFTDTRLTDTNSGNNPGAGVAFPMLDHATIDPTSVADDLDLSTLDQFGNPTGVSIALGTSGFQRFWQIADEDSNTELPGPDVKRINVVVRFKDSELSYGFRQVNVTVIKPWSL
jgi:type IV pilus modification protein PilV